MPARRSPDERSDGGSREAGARRPWPAGEDVPVRLLEGIERRQPAAREQADRATDATAEPLAQAPARVQELAGALALEAEQLGKGPAWPVERRHPEAAPVFGWEVYAAEREVPRHVLEEVDELESGADLVAR